MSPAGRPTSPSHAAPDAAVTARGRRGVFRGWRPALLIAGRTAWRHRGRTALIVALIAMPVLAMSFLAVVFRTQELPAAERATRMMGTADGFAIVHAIDRIDPPDPQSPDSYGYDDESTARDPREVDLSALLPAGSRVVPAPSEFGGITTLSTEDVRVRANVVVDGLDGPLTAGMYELREGVVPATTDEVALGPGIADRLDVVIGDRVSLDTGASVTVVGLAVNPDCLLCDTAFAAEPLTEPSEAEAAALLSAAPRFLVDLPPGADPHALWLGLAEEGVSFSPREAILDPASYQAYPDMQQPGDLATIGAVALIGGFGLLEVVLLAGTAFAVGTRRQIRELGWVAANGGTRRDVRRVVLAQGVVLGVVAAIVGVALSIVAVLVGEPWLERLSGKLFAGLVLRPLELAGIAAFGLLAGVLAALLPARAAARVPVMAALGDHFTPPTRPLRRPLVGLAVMVVGVVLSFGAGLRVSSLDAAYRASLQDTDDGGVMVVDGSLAPPSTGAYTAAVLVGITLAILGTLVALPSLVALAGRLSSRLPFLPRLALRDAGRHRHRTAPAIGAIMLVVGGTVALGFTLAGDHEKNRAGYEPNLPYGDASVSHFGEAAEANGPARARAVEAAAETLGARAALPVTYPGVMVAVGPGESYVDGLQVALCGHTFTVDCYPQGGQVVVGDTELLSALTGSPASRAAVDVLAGGGVVVLHEDPATVPAGDAWVGLYSGFNLAQAAVDPTDDYELDVDDLGFGADVDPAATRVWQLPTAIVEAPDLIVAGAVISPATATELGLTAQTDQTLLVTDQAPTQAAEDRARADLEPLGMGLQVERGHQSDLLPILAVLGGVSGLVTVGGVAIAVGLAAAEGRADLATLGAVGAPPRRRRLIAMAQAGVVGVLGCLLGMALGTFVAAVAYQGFTIGFWVVPWPLLAIIGFAVPAVAVLVAGLFTRSRLPMVRRAA